MLHQVIKHTLQENQQHECCIASNNISWNGSNNMNVALFKQRIQQGKQQHESCIILKNIPYKDSNIMNVALCHTTYPTRTAAISLLYQV